MADELNPYNDQDKTLRLVQLVVSEIMGEVLGAEDLLDDMQRSRIMANCINLLEQLAVNIEEYIPAEIVDAYRAGWELGGDLLIENGITGIEGIQGNLTSLVHAEAVQSIALEAIDDMQAAIRTAARFLMSIEETLQGVHDQIGTGLIKGQTTRDITKLVQRQFLEAGLTSFITIDNRALPLDFYAMTVTRTKVRKAQIEGSLNRYKENGHDLVRINKRSFTCKVCGAREGVVISPEGETEGFPTFADIGGPPPFHPNCRHYIIPLTREEADRAAPDFFIERDLRTAASKETYENEQKIRQEANREKKQYAKMAAEAAANGEDFPSIGTWRRMKRANNDKWKGLQQRYRESISKLPYTLGEAPKFNGVNGANVDNVKKIKKIIEKSKDK